MVKNSRTRRSRRATSAVPVLYIREDVALATADSTSNSTVYTSPTSVTALNKPVRFTLGPTRISFKAGLTETTVFAVVRKVPQGYTTPTIAPTDGNTTFDDVPNVLGYGVARIVPTNDAMNRVDMRFLTKSVTLSRGDSVVLQVVSNVSSTNLAYSAMCEYSTV